jgi:hypothetical protein
MIHDSLQSYAMQIFWPFKGLQATAVRPQLACVQTPLPTSFGVWDCTQAIHTKVRELYLYYIYMQLLCITT